MLYQLGSTRTFLDFLKARREEYTNASVFPLTSVVLGGGSLLGTKNDPDLRLVGFT